MIRLTARNKEGFAYFPQCFEEPCGGSGCEKDQCEFIEKVCETLAECEEICLTTDQIKQMDMIDGEKCQEVNELKKRIEELQEYRKIGTLEEVREDVEKKKKKRPTYDGDGYDPDGNFIWDEWICPCCRKRYEVDYDDYDYCPNCGQHIDWSEEE